MKKREEDLGEEDILVFSSCPVLSCPVLFFIFLNAPFQLSLLISSSHLSRPVLLTFPLLSFLTSFCALSQPLLNSALFARLVFTILYCPTPPFHLLSSFLYFPFLLTANPSDFSFSFFFFYFFFYSSHNPILFFSSPFCSLFFSPLIFFSFSSTSCS